MVEKSKYVYRFERNIFPTDISIGNCTNIRNCKAANVDLADGWCVNCWDKSAEARDRLVNTLERRKEEKKSKQLIKEFNQRLKVKRLGNIPDGRERHKKDCQCDVHLKKGFV